MGPWDPYRPLSSCPHPPPLFIGCAPASKAIFPRSVCRGAEAFGVQIRMPLRHDEILLLGLTQVIGLFFFSIWEGRDWLIDRSTYLCIPLLILVCGLTGVRTLMYRDDALTNWAAQPGPQVIRLLHDLTHLEYQPIHPSPSLSPLWSTCPFSSLKYQRRILTPPYLHRACYRTRRGLQDCLVYSSLSCKLGTLLVFLFQCC